MPKQDIKFGIAFTEKEWKEIQAALRFKTMRAHEMGIVTYVESLIEIDHYITHSLRKLT